MRILDNGVYRDMTEDEIKANLPENLEEKKQPSLEERLSALEAAMLEQILRGVTND